MSSNHFFGSHNRYIVIGGGVFETYGTREAACEAMSRGIEHAILIDTFATPDRLMALMGAILISIENSPFSEQEVADGDKRPF
jgi:hypothetical protein